MRQIPIEERFRFDKSLDLFFQGFCQALIKEVSSGPVKREVTSFVDHYGKEVRGFLTYSEFKDIYKFHVIPVLGKSGLDDDDLLKGGASHLKKQDKQ